MRMLKPLPNDFWIQNCSEGYLAATFDLMLELASLLGFDFHSHLVAAVFKLDFRTHAPTMSEVIAKVNYHMRQIKTPMAFCICIG
jgi:hypothetical protein